MNKGTTRHQHYVSQFLLRRFCGPEGRLWAYDTETQKVFCADPKAVAAEGYFYSDSRKYPTKASIAIEHWLAEEIEGPGSKAIEGLISMRTLSLEEIRAFIRFVAAQMQRTPTALQRVSECYKATFQEMVERMLKYEPEVRKNILDDMKAAGAHADNVSQMLEIMDQGKIEVTPTREFSIWTGIRNIEFIASELAKMRWEFAQVPKTDEDLIIGDHPVTLADVGGADKPAGRLGLRNPNIEVVVPLSSRFVALAHWQGEVRYGELGVGGAAELNERMLRHIHRFAYASFESQDLLKRAVALRGTGPKIHTHRLKIGEKLIIAPEFK